MEYKIFDSELKILEILWEGGETSAKEVAALAGEQVGWSKTTTYTVLKKCVEKQAVSRTDPGFLCRPLISRKEVQKAATEDLIERMYGGSRDLLIASLLGKQEMKPEEIARLKQMVEELE